MEEKGVRGREGRGREGKGGERKGEEKGREQTILYSHIDIKKKLMKCQLAAKHTYTTPTLSAQNPYQQFLPGTLPELF